MDRIVLFRRKSFTFKNCNIQGATEAFEVGDLTVVVISQMKIRQEFESIWQKNEIRRFDSIG